MKSISTGELREAMARGEVQILDTRPMDAYNGWRLSGEARGGHLPGARALPAAWLRFEEWPDILGDKGIRPDRPVVVYGSDRAGPAAVADRLESAGFGDVAWYEAFLEEWVGDPSQPLVRLPRYRHLVPPQWLAEVLAGGRPEEYEGTEVAVCHCHYRNPGDYDLGHVPGAVALDTLALEDPETWNRRSPQELEEALLAHGIRADTTVVVYGRFSHPRSEDPHPGSAAGHLGAIRCGLIMMYAGVSDVRVLNGSVTAWEAAGYELSRQPVAPRRAASFGAEVPARPELFVDTPEAKEILASPDANLVSVRSWAEFVGEVSGYHYIEAKGRIPGAVFGNCGSDAYHMENYRNLDHTTREWHEVEAMWRQAGITRDKRNAFYCGTGWRASEAWLNAFLMGWDRIAVYDGGWYEWSADPGHPREVGEP